MKTIFTYLYISIGMFILWFGCSRNNDQIIVIESWPIEDVIDGERIDLEYSEHLTNLGYFSGDYLIFNTYKSSYCFLVYDKNFNFVDSLVTKGGGPKELPDAMFYGQTLSQTSIPKILIYSESLNRIASLSIQSDSAPVKIADIPSSSMVSPSSIFQIEDNVFCGVSLQIFGGAELFRFNSNSNVTELYPLPFEFKDQNQFYTTQQSLAYNPDKKEFCSAYISVPWIVIYDKDFIVKRKIAIGQEINTLNLTMESKFPSLSMVTYYGSHILVYYKKEAGNPESQLLVIDNQGNPEAAFNIGDAIGYITDSLNGRLLTVHYDKEADIIYLKSSPMPDLLLN